MAGVLPCLDIGAPGGRAAEDIMRFGLILLAGALAAGPAAAAQRHDADVEKDVRSAILRDVNYGVFDSVGVAVKDGHVLMQGSVRRGSVRNDLEKRVARVAGVRSVTNEVRVQSTSFSDDRLRLQLYRAIYGGVLLPHTVTAEPVRIVVDRGRVTLTGYVNSRVEQVKVGIVARDTMAFAVDNQVKLDGEQNAETPTM